MCTMNKNEWETEQGRTDTHTKNWNEFRSRMIFLDSNGSMLDAEIVQ